MKKTFSRTSVLISSALAISLAVSSVANAAPASGNSVTVAQQRLTALGYYAGVNDGKMGEVTRDAIRDFQARNGIEVNGELNRETAQLLKTEHLAAVKGYYNAPNYAYNGTAYNGAYNANYAANYAYTPNGYAANTGSVPVAYNGYASNWNAVKTQAVPVRFGALAINDDMTSGTHNSSVMLNGRAVLTANNQPQALRVSNTYRLNGEDAVIFTAYDGTSSCNYKSYLLTVRANGTYTTPQQVGNCSGAYQARVENNMLYISFNTIGYAGQYASLDTWRYGYDTLGRI